MRSLLFGEEIKVNVIGGSGVMSVDAPISHWSVSICGVGEQDINRFFFPLLCLPTVSYLSAAYIGKYDFVDAFMYIHINRFRIVVCNISDSNRQNDGIHSLLLLYVHMYKTSYCSCLAFGQ